MESRLERNRGLQTPTLVFHLYPILINLLKERISGLLNEPVANSEITPSPTQIYLYHPDVLWGLRRPLMWYLLAQATATPAKGSTQEMLLCSRDICKN